MLYSEAIELMRNQNLLYVKVIDTKGNRVMDFLEEDSVENTISKLNQYKTTLTSYGALTFICANETVKKQNFKDAFKWHVTFAETQLPQTLQQGMGSVPIGYISQSEASLLATLQGLQSQMKFDAELQKLREEINAKKDNGFEKYLPMAALLFDIPAEKMQMFMAMQGMSQQTKNHSSGINGLNENKIEMQATPEEQKELDEIHENVQILIEKIGQEKVNKLLQFLNANPNMLEMSLQFIPK